MTRNLWWQQGVIYQIYPRSFMDSNGDGIGDLQGITDRLDYLVELGIDAIWISPIFPSPMKDFGYDISDYTDIHPMFGDMAAFDRLLEAAHRRKIRVLLDYVPNHTSDQHPWFIESRASRRNPRRDWYIWKDPGPDGGPPNNWQSLFGGSAWEWDAHTQQYYLHIFLKEQPDLNWRNPEVVEAMHNVLRFWLDKGVDGFRMDAIVCCAKNPEFPDNPPAGEGSFFAAYGLSQEPIHYWNYPDVHGILRGFRKVLEPYGEDRIAMGETAIFEPAVLAQYYGENLDELHIPLNFITLMQPWDAAAMKAAIQAYYAALPAGATPNFFFGNHDFHRLATRFGAQNVRAAAILLLTLRGLPIIYYGEELGMEDTPVPPERLQDPIGKARPDLNIGRDPERTPMQWDASANAGFSPPGVQTWLPVAENYRQVNVEVQRRDPTSTLNLYKALLKLRRANPALHQGDIHFIDRTPDDVLAYTRRAGGQAILTAINFGENAYELDLAEAGEVGEILLTTHFSAVRRVSLKALPVGKREGVIVSLV